MFPDYSRSVVQKVIDAGAVLVNGNPAKVKEATRQFVFLPPDVDTLADDPDAWAPR